MERDTTVTKIDSTHSPRGSMGQKYLASGKTVSMRLWEALSSKHTSPEARDYETVGFVLDGSAELSIEGQKVKLEKGDSWVVPKGALHQYAHLDNFSAVEATAPPAQVHDRDAPPE